MARVLGYGGIGNTNGARDFSSKASGVSPGRIIFPIDILGITKITSFLLSLFQS